MIISLRIFAFFVILLFLAPILALLNEGSRAFLSEAFAVTPERLFQYARNSFLLVCGSLVGAVFFGGLSAVLCARFEFRGRRLLQWLSILPLGVPSYLVAYSWVDFLVDQGVPGGWLRNMPLTSFIFGLCLSPYVYLPVYGALLTVPGSLVESARLLGRSRIQTFFQIEVPLVRPALFAGSLLAAMEVLADFGTVDFMAIDTWSTGIYRSWFGYGDRPRAALLALVLFSLSGLLFFGEARIRERQSLARSGRSVSNIARIPLRGFKALPYALLAALPALLACFATLTILLRSSFVSVGMNHWQDILQPTLSTLSLALSSATLIVVLGFIFVFLLRIQHTRFWEFCIRAGTLGYALPGGVIGIGLLVLLAPFSLSGSVVGLMFAYCIRFITLGSSTLEAAWATIPRVYEEQARVLGCTPAGVLWRVNIPLLKKSIACAFVLACIDIIKELPASMLLRPFNFETLAIRTYNLASDERLAETAPASLLMILLCLVGVFIAQALGAFKTKIRNSAEGV